jgi:tripartite-type tricarboxylate transporter receptor subunit TctC
MEKSTAGRFMILFLLSVFGLVSSAEAQTPAYPRKSIKFICAVSAGAAADLTGRALVEAVKQFLPQPVAVINKPGGAGSVGTAEVVQSAPDGYTLGQGYGPAVCLQPYLNKDLPYKGPADIQAVISMGKAPIVIACRGDAPWKTLKEMIAYAKANPGKIRAGSAGIGSISHIMLEELKRAAGVDITHVPFAGSAPSVPALLGGHIEISLANPTPFLPHVHSGAMKALAVFEDKRIDVFPDTPTVEELGYAVHNLGSYYFVFAPKGTPKNAVQVLYEAFLKAEKTGAYQKWCKDNGILLDYKGPDDLKKVLDSDYAFYAGLIKRGVKLK